MTEGAKGRHGGPRPNSGGAREGAGAKPRTPGGKFQAGYRRAVKMAQKAGPLPGNDIGYAYLWKNTDNDWFATLDRVDAVRGVKRSGGILTVWADGNVSVPTGRGD